MNRATVSGKIPGGFSFLHSQIASESPVESVREHQEQRKDVQGVSMATKPSLFQRNG